MITLRRLGLGIGCSVLVACSACTFTTTPSERETGGAPNAPTSAGPASPVAPSRSDVENILTDYDTRNNRAITGKGEWKEADGGTLLSGDAYSDLVQARAAKNQGKKPATGEPLTTQLIDVLAWGADGATQTLVVSNSVRETVTGRVLSHGRVSVLVKRGGSPWRMWAAVSLPGADALPKPTEPLGTVTDAEAATVSAINRYRETGSKPKNVTLGKNFATYFSVLKKGLVGFETSRSCRTSTDQGVASAWQVPTAAGTMTLIANRCDERAAAPSTGWISWTWSDDKIFGVAGKHYRSYACQLSGPTVQLTANNKSRWYGPGYYRLSKCTFKR